MELDPRVQGEMSPPPVGGRSGSRPSPGTGSLVGEHRGDGLAGQEAGGVAPMARSTAWFRAASPDAWSTPGCPKLQLPWPSNRLAPPQSPRNNRFSTYHVPPRFDPPARKGGRSCKLLDGPPTAEGFPAPAPPSA